MTPAQSRAAAQVMRPEIQVLRAIAVGSVLIYHLWPGRLTGGFVGVDIFFVISGFLITGQLVRDVEVSGRIRLGRFWARRARRLLPASLLVIAVVTIATWTLVDLGLRTNFFGHAIASTFYGENWYLAHQSVQYGNSDVVQPPLEHYWSLGVEEQFYVLTPLLLLTLAFVAARCRQSVHRFLLPAFVLVAGVSLWWSVTQTASHPGPAYFSPFTRAWEFLLGAILSVVAVRGGAWLRGAYGLVGLTCIGYAVATYAVGVTPFPSYTAALPAVGALAIIAAGSSGPVAWLGRIRFLTWIGDISYAIYLWHWPLIVLLPYALHRSLTTSDRLGILIGTVGIAWASTRFVETPLRNRPRSLEGVRPLLIVGLVSVLATAGVATLGVIGSAQARADVRNLEAQSRALLDAADVTCLGANVALGRGNCPSYGDVILPLPAAARYDDGNDPTCWVSNGTVTPRICEAVRPDHPTLRVLAIGDSHSGSLDPAYKAMATVHRWALDITGKSGCQWTTGATALSDTTVRTDCQQWKEAIRKRLDSGPAYDLIVTTADAAARLVHAEGQTEDQATVAGFRQAWAEQIARGAVVVAIDDVPEGRSDIAECVEEAGTDAATRCATSEAVAYDRVDPLADAVRATPGSALVTLRDILCKNGLCPAVIGNVVVYHYQGHVTATFARTLAPILGERIMAAYDKIRHAR